MPYADIQFADTYFSERAFADAWISATNKAGLLKLASNLIDIYTQFYDDNSYPVTYDKSDAPEWLKEAVCEEALYLANIGKDPSQPDDVTIMGISSTKGTVFDRSMRADILCVQCRNIIEKNNGEISPEAVAGNNISFGRVIK